VLHHLVVAAAVVDQLQTYQVILKAAVAAVVLVF
jgi:hypothetical protein